jgi:hypothetical protein
VLLFLIAGAGVSTMFFGLARRFRRRASNRSGRSGAKWSATRGRVGREAS